MGGTCNGIPLVTPKVNRAGTIQHRHAARVFINPAIALLRLRLPRRCTMALTIIRVPSPSGKKPKKANGHTKAVAPTISLDQPGRLRVAHVLSIYGISHSTLYAGLKRKRYPKPDGYDGVMPYWMTSTIRQSLEQQ